MALTQVSTSGIKDATIATADIAADAITGALIADNAIGAEHIEDLDANVQWLDSKKALFGFSSDLEIFHDGTESWIKDVGTGDLNICAKDLQIKNADDDEFYMTAVEDGAVSLYYDNELKLSTSATGVDIQDASATSVWTKLSNSSGIAGYIYGNGATEIGFLDGQQHWTVKSTKDGDVKLYYDNSEKMSTASWGVDVQGTLRADVLNLLDSEPIKCGTDADLQLQHNGTNSFIENGTGDLYVKCNSNDMYLQAFEDIFIRPDSGDNGIKVLKDAACELYYSNSKKLETTSTGAKVTGTLEQTGYCLDEWRLHTSLRGDTNPITNWERCDTSGMANKLIDDSSGMTESSGVFSFPSTGKWKITTWMQWQTPSGQTEAWAGMFGTFTQDNSSYTTQDWGYAAMAAGSSYQKANGGFTVDVTNSSDAKLKFYTVMQQSNNSTGTYLLGQTAYNATWVRFERIGDT